MSKRYDRIIDSNHFNPGLSQEKILMQIRPGSTVLECGCATGYMTRYMRDELGCEVSIVEYDAESYAVARQYASDGICADLTQSEWLAKFQGKRFDYILFADVLEHLYDPQAVLKSVVSLLKEDGSVLASVPNIAHGDVLLNLWKGNWNYTEVGLLDRTHIRFFAENNLDSFFEGAGLSIVRLDCTRLPVGWTEQAGDPISADAEFFNILAMREASEAYQFIICAQTIEYAEQHHIKKEQLARLYQTTAALYYSQGDGFSEKNTQKVIYTAPDFHQRFAWKSLQPKALRFDPVEGQNCVVTSLQVFSNEGELEIFPVNGYRLGNMDFFVTADPQYSIMSEDLSIRWVEIHARIELVSDGQLQPWLAQLVRNCIKLEEVLRAQVLEIGKLTQQHEEAERELVRQHEEARRELVRQYEEAERELVRQHEEARRELVRQYEEAEQEQMRRHEETKRGLVREQERIRQDLMQQCEEIRQQLVQVQYSYSVISNAFFWKITKPARLMADIWKLCVYKVKGFLRLSKKSVFVLQTEGISGFRKKYRAYWEKRKTAAAENDRGYLVLNSFFQSNLPEPEIPQEWIELQRMKPLISIIMAVKCVRDNEGCLVRALDSLLAQKYKNFEIVIVYRAAERSTAERIVLPYKECLNIKLVPEEQEGQRFVFWDKAMDSASGEFIGIMEQEDMLTENALAYVLEGCNECPDMQLFMIPDDRFFEDGCYFSPDYKVGLEYGIGGWETLLRFGVFRNHGYKFSDGGMERWLRGLKKEKITVFPWVGCHGYALPSMWEEPDVRCLAFYLPQFHEIPENNLWWGDGFTEWVNVKGAKPLYQGHQQPRRPGELGYYDLAGEAGRKVQKRQIELAKEYGLNGFCYYYYWFDGGKRLLEMPLDRHLQDQTMDFPFCICWANENWTRQWDGQNNEIIMPQTYKDGWAEQFIMDLIPYLKDKRYVCVNGAPYILIYNVEDMTEAADAINTWRRIAAEKGIERLHISAVKRTPDGRELEIAGHTLDSLTDFPPHLLGQIGVDHDRAEKFGLAQGQIKDYRKACAYHIGVEKQRYTYFRTAMLAWDNTARRKNKAYIFEEFSLTDYKKWLYAAKRYVLRQNREGENLLFINAWNEWAEGTYLEPSEPMGNAALTATSEVLKMR